MNHLLSPPFGAGNINILNFYFVNVSARTSSVTHSPVRCFQSPCRFAPSSWTAVAWTVPSSHDNFSLVIESISILAVARSQSNFTLLVFLGVPCIGRTSASTSLLHSSYKQCYAFRMSRMREHIHWGSFYILIAVFA